MDGNRRWAKRHGLPAIEGHRRGIVALRRVTRAASDLGIEALTAYGFSTENWNRDAREISLLFELCVYFARNELAELQRNNVRVRVIGEWESLPDAPRRALADLQAGTVGNTGLLLNLAVNYSSHAELERAMRAIGREVAAGTLKPDEIDEASIARYLYTAGLPELDLLIRPGGEHRLSNFLLYQAAYAELVMTDVFWPDFSGEHLRRAIAEFQHRERRFGGA
ncbi:MAG: di-trans,poly-cis-decaprenylcistransferase [Candidatus Eremiobacteraeota bacterium]|nr:di-trans,poly-cis-decaprenylcistransferase [Candidatus Eremiobacteraeota bacterium]MBV8374164.1 di-trans,poly-cis-decaprenylcistransferase [Candidatus Eremiobacteraeota bacterium]